MSRPAMSITTTDSRPTFSSTPTNGLDRYPIIGHPQVQCNVHARLQVGEGCAAGTWVGNLALQG